jgi:hypothetical protein
MSGNDNRDNAQYQLDVTLTVPASVYMLIDNRLGAVADNTTPPQFDATHMQWILDEGWAATANGLNRAGDPALPDEVPIDEGADGGINQWYSVYEKIYPAGTFSLLQADNGGQNMYGVVIKPTDGTLPDPGDFNSDGSVDLVDFNILASNMSLTFPITESFSKGDNNRDSRVNLRDFIEFREIFNAQAQGAAASVPEPTGTTLAVLAFVSTMFSTFRRRR